MDWVYLIVVLGVGHGLVFGLSLVAKSIAKKGNHLFSGLFIIAFSIVVLGWVGYSN